MADPHTQKPPFTSIPQNTLNYLNPINYWTTISPQVNNKNRVIIALRKDVINPNSPEKFTFFYKKECKMSLQDLNLKGTLQKMFLNSWFFKNDPQLMIFLNFQKWSSTHDLNFPAKFTKIFRQQTRRIKFNFEFQASLWLSHAILSLRLDKKRNFAARGFPHFFPVLMTWKMFNCRQTRLAVIWSEKYYFLCFAAQSSSILSF